MYRYPGLVGSWFGGLTLSTPFYIVGYVGFECGPPVVFFDSYPSLTNFGVSSSVIVMIEGKHPLLKFIVFWNNKLFFVVKEIIILV